MSRLDPTFKQLASGWESEEGTHEKGGELQRRVFLYS